jgi:hypothetical protein
MIRERPCSLPRSRVRSTERMVRAMTAATISQSGLVPETPRPVLMGTTQDGEMHIVQPVLTGSLAHLASGGHQFLSPEERQFIVGRVSGRARRWAMDAEMLVVRLDKTGQVHAFFRRCPQVHESRALFNAWYVTSPIFDESMRRYERGGRWELGRAERQQIVSTVTGRVQEWTDMAEVMLVHVEKHENVRTLAVHFMARRIPPVIIG